MNRTYYMETYGCQMNHSDSESLVGLLSEKNFFRVRSVDEADVVIINTCVVRQHAEDKVYSRLGSIRKKYGRSKDVVVMGCLAQKEGKTLQRKFPFVRHVIGTWNLEELPALLTDLGSVSVKTETEDFSFLHSAQEEGHSYRARLSIIHGCDNSCAYCIVPQVRGRQISRKSREIIQEAELLVSKGVKEILLLGQNVNSYGQDSGDIDFGELLMELNRVEGLCRIRFMTSHPKDFSAQLADRILNLESVCPYIHLPVQSGSDRVLRLMNRGYDLAHYKSLIRHIQKNWPGAGLSTDILVGFPGEEEEDFQDTLSLMREAEFDEAFMFMYSPRPGTGSAQRRETVSQEGKADRLQKVIALQRSLSLKRTKLQIGSEEEVLVEELSKKNTEEYSSRTAANRIVIIPGKGLQPGDFCMVKINEMSGGTLRGELL